MGVLFLMLFIPWIKGCFRPKPKEIITFIDLAASSPSVPEIAPEPEPTPKVIPKPEPKPKPTPKPVVSNTPPKVVKATPKPPPKATPKPAPKPPPKKPTPKPEPKPAPKQTEAEKLAAIRQNNVVTKPNTKPAPKLDFSGLKSALNSAAEGSGTGGGTYSPFAGYYDSITQRMYAVWQQPSGAQQGLSAVATIRVESDGTVSAKFITRRSGNVVFDQSVQNALNATTRLPVPPADLPDRNISIEFVLSN